MFYHKVLFENIVYIIIRVMLVHITIQIALPMVAWHEAFSLILSRLTFCYLIMTALFNLGGQWYPYKHHKTSHSMCEDSARIIWTPITGNISDIYKLTRFRFHLGHTRQKYIINLRIASAREGQAAYKHTDVLSHD